MAYNRHGKRDFSTLDIGCGGGDFEPNPHGQINLDISRPKHKIQNFVLGDGQKLPFKEGAFKKILCIEVIEHVPAPLLIVEECYRVLEVEGRLMMSTPNAFYITKLVRTLLRGQYSEYTDHICSYTYVTLRQLMNRVFKKVRIEFMTLPRKNENPPHAWIYKLLIRITPFRPFRSRMLVAYAKK